MDGLSTDSKDAPRSTDTKIYGCGTPCQHPRVTESGCEGEGRESMRYEKQYQTMSMPYVAISEVHLCVFVPKH